MNAEFKLAKDLVTGDIIFDIDTEMPKEIINIEYPDPETVTVFVRGDYEDTWSYDFDSNEELELVPPSEYKMYGYDERTYDPFEETEVVTESGAIAALGSLIRRCAILAIQDLARNATVDIKDNGSGSYTADINYRDKAYSINFNASDMIGKSKEFIISKLKKLFGSKVEEDTVVTESEETNNASDFNFYVEQLMKLRKDYMTRLASTDSTSAQWPLSVKMYRASNIATDESEMALFYAWCENVWEIFKAYCEEVFEDDLTDIFEFDNHHQSYFRFNDRLGVITDDYADWSSADKFVEWLEDNSYIEDEFDINSIRALESEESQLFSKINNVITTYNNLKNSQEKDFKEFLSQNSSEETDFAITKSIGIGEI